MKKYFHTIPKWLRLLMPRAVYDIKTKGNKCVYLTFDDGPIPDVTEWVLDVLAKYNFKATFFVIGNNVVQYPHIYQKILAAGHSVGNHTFTHKNASKTDKNLYLNDVRKAKNVVDSPLFRPPFGRINHSIASALNKEGFRIVMWSMLSGDFDNNLKPEKCLQILKSKVKVGDVIVFHDSLKAQKTLAFVLPLFCEFLQENGYESKEIEMKKLKHFPFI